MALNLEALVWPTHPFIQACHPTTGHSDRASLAWSLQQGLTLCTLPVTRVPGQDRLTFHFPHIKPCTGTRNVWATGLNLNSDCFAVPSSLCPGSSLCSISWLLNLACSATCTLYLISWLLIWFISRPHSQTDLLAACPWTLLAPHDPGWHLLTLAGISRDGGKGWTLQRMVPFNQKWNNQVQSPWQAIGGEGCLCPSKQVSGAGVSVTHP